MIQYFQIADLIFSLEYDDETSPFAVIADKIGLVRISAGIPQIRFQWRNRPATVKAPVTKLEKSVVGNGFFQTRTRQGDTLQLEADESGSLTVGISGPRAGAGKRFRQFLKKYWKYRFLYGISFNEMHAKKIMYGILEPVFLAWFAGHGKTLVHSSTVEKDGKSFLYPAWGGVGKTSLMSYFLSAGWNYLGDDIAVLSTDGRLHHFPLPMHIYGYHKFVCADMYKRMVAGMTPADRRIWDLSMRLYPPDEMSRWVRPEQVYGKERIALNSKLQTVIHMQRSSVSESLIFRETTPQNVARYVTNTIINEIPGILPMTSYPNSHAAIPCLPDTRQMLETLERNAAQGFSNAAVYEMILGPETTPEETWKYLRERFPGL